MEISISTNDIKAIIAEEVSIAADQAYSQDGISLYDSIVLSSKDDALVGRLIKDAIAQLARRESDICTYTASAITFNISDAAATSTVITAELNRYIALHACADLFQSRKADLVPDYTRRAQEAMDNVDSLVRTRTAPTRS